MKDINKSFLPVLALLISTIGVASAIIFVKLSEVDATATLMLRMFVAGSVASAITFWQSDTVEKKNSVESLNTSRNNTILLILSGAISTIDLLSNHWAVKMTSVANTTILMNLSPVFVALLSFIFFKERVGIYKLLALALAVAGACVLVFDGQATFELSGPSLIGDLLALNSALFYAIYMLLIKSLRNSFSSSKIIIWNSFTCAILLLPVALSSSPQLLPTTLFGYTVIVLLALISQLLGHGLMAYALKHVDVVLASVSTLARPIVAILLGSFIFNEKLIFMQWVGVVGVLLGIYWYKRPSSPSRAVAKNSA